MSVFNVRIITLTHDSLTCIISQKIALGLRLNFITSGTNHSDYTVLILSSQLQRTISNVFALCEASLWAEGKISSASFKHGDYKPNIKFNTLK